MAIATQAQVRSWARAQGMTVNTRGSLSASISQAYAAAHPRNAKGTTMTSPARTASARQAKAGKATAGTATARKATARKTTPRTATARKTTPRKTTPRKTTPRKTTPRTATAVASVEVVAPAAGSTDLAGGLRSYLGSIETEVRAVSSLSERIDGLVAELNDLRDQQTKRLTVLDELRASVSDQALGSFLDQAIRPRKTRVPEVIPERLI